MELYFSGGFADIKIFSYSFIGHLGFVVSFLWLKSGSFFFFGRMGKEVGKRELACCIKMLSTQINFIKEYTFENCESGTCFL